MSNRIDFFQSAETRLSLPAPTFSVSVDGALCAYLELKEVVRAGWPEFSWARLVYNPAAYTGPRLMRVEEIESKFGIGRTVCIEQIYNGCAPGGGAVSFPVFAGEVDSVETQLGPDREIMEVIAKDLGAALKRISVYGQRVGNSDGSTVFLTGLGTTFNAEGKGNAKIEPIEDNGSSYTVFCAEPSNAKPWSYAEVIRYLLCEYLPQGRLQVPSTQRLRALTENRTVCELDVTGLNLADALHRCCERTGLEFKFVPRPVPIGPAQAVVFYRSGRGRGVELNHQWSGERLSISKTDVARLNSTRTFWPITHKYIGQGDFKVYEATFELVKAWDPADEDTDYDKFSPSTNPEFYKTKDVYRKWCLNEAGDYSSTPYNQGEAFDFTKIFEGGNFVPRCRRFWPALTTDKQGKSVGYFFEVSFDNGQYWWQYLYAFNNLLDECGVWLSSDRLDVNTWVAALKGVLKFRITASVISDERLSCVVADGPVGSTVPVVEHIVRLPRQFRYQKVSGQSIFASAADYAIGEADEVDNTEALCEFVRNKAEAASEVIETVDVQTPYLAFDYQVGDRVTCSPESRDLLSCRRDNRSVSWIKRVQMDFEKQCTNLRIVRQRKYPL
ncbi:MAG TPA: hypothetical protein VMX13_01045 [Sedimentisphaerales bacterium]|nr:hypothetical protein [Sedimentisphaerales bacterium]